MLRVETQNGIIEVKFDHRFLDENAIESLTGMCVYGSRRCSMVTITKDGRELGRGMCVCNPVDNFNKKVGRKLSLRYALDMAGLNKTIRSKIWKQYRATTKH